MCFPLPAPAVPGLLQDQRQKVRAWGVVLVACPEAFYIVGVKRLKHATKELRDEPAPFRDTACV